MNGLRATGAYSLRPTPIRAKELGDRVSAGLWGDADNTDRISDRAQVVQVTYEVMDREGEHEMEIWANQGITQDTVRGKSRFTVVSTHSTIYSCIVIY